MLTLASLLTVDLPSASSPNTTGSLSAQPASLKGRGAKRLGSENSLHHLFVSLSEWFGSQVKAASGSFVSTLSWIWDTLCSDGDEITVGHGRGTSLVIDDPHLKRISEARGNAQESHPCFLLEGREGQQSLQDQKGKTVPRLPDTIRGPLVVKNLKGPVYSCRKHPKNPGKLAAKLLPAELAAKLLCQSPKE
jgi:hypothetical protein